MKHFKLSVICVRWFWRYTETSWRQTVYTTLTTTQQICILLTTTQKYNVCRVDKLLRHDDLDEKLVELSSWCIACNLLTWEITYFRRVISSYVQKTQQLDNLILFVKKSHYRHMSTRQISYLWRVVLLYYTHSINLQLLVCPFRTTVNMSLITWY